MKNFHHKAQLLVDGAAFLELGNTILKAQMGDKFFELIVFLPKGFRTLEIANLLHRIVQAGAKVGLFEIEIFNQELEQFAILDNKLLLSNRLHSIEEGVFPLILQKHTDFELIMNNSLPVNPSSQEIKMKFTANSYFVSKGQEVELSWLVENASSISLNPGNRMIEAEGNAAFLIENDILFTITSRNAKNKSILSIFISCLEEEQFLITVSVFNRELTTYVKIDPISQGDESFAVYRGDLLRVEWECKSATSLTEAGLGRLKNVGFYNFICLENRQFDFELELLNGKFKKQLKIYTFSMSGLISKSQNRIDPNSTTTIEKAKLNPKRGFINWMRKLVRVLKIRRKNGRL
jgi:hypothetical protein